MRVHVYQAFAKCAYRLLRWFALLASYRPSLGLNNPFTLSSYHVEWAAGGLPPIETGGASASSPPDRVGASMMGQSAGPRASYRGSTSASQAESGVRFPSLALRVSAGQGRFRAPFVDCRLGLGPRFLKHVRAQRTAIHACEQRSQAHRSTKRSKWSIRSGIMWGGMAALCRPASVFGGPTTSAPSMSWFTERSTLSVSGSGSKPERRRVRHSPRLRPYHTDRTWVRTVPGKAHRRRRRSNAVEPASGLTTPPM